MQDDAQSDTSDPMSLSGYKYSRSDWSSAKQLGLPANNNGQQYGFGDGADWSGAFPSDNSVRRSAQTMGPPPLGPASRFGRNSHLRIDTSASSKYCMEEPNYSRSCHVGYGYSCDSAVDLRGSGWNGAPPHGTSFDAYFSGASPPITPLPSVGLHSTTANNTNTVTVYNGGARYLPRPVGTPLSPHAIEFNGTTAPSAPWNAQVSDAVRPDSVP